MITYLDQSQSINVNEKPATKGELTSFKNSDISKWQFYKDAIQGVNTLRDKLQDMMNKRMDGAVIRVQFANLVRQWGFNYYLGLHRYIFVGNTFLDNLQKQLTEDKQASNPTQELINRQDFDARINSYDQQELSKYIDSVAGLSELGKLNSLIKVGQPVEFLTDYEINRLLSLTKNSISLQSRLKSYKELKEKAFKDTPEGKDAKRKLQIANTMISFCNVTYNVGEDVTTPDKAFAFSSALHPVAIFNVNIQEFVTPNTTSVDNTSEFITPISDLENALSQYSIIDPDQRTRENMTLIDPRQNNPRVVTINGQQLQSVL